MTGLGGSIRILWDSSETGQVTITGGSWTVGGNPASFPYDITTSTTFTTTSDCAGTISVELFGVEIANTPDGTKTFEIRQGSQLVFAPSIDAAPSSDDLVGKVDSLVAGAIGDNSSDTNAALTASIATTATPIATARSISLNIALGGI